MEDKKCLSDFRDRLIGMTTKERKAVAASLMIRPLGTISSHRKAGHSKLDWGYQFERAGQLHRVCATVFKTIFFDFVSERSIRTIRSNVECGKNATAENRGGANNNLTIDTINLVYTHLNDSTEVPRKERHYTNRSKQNEDQTVLEKRSYDAMWLTFLKKYQPKCRDQLLEARRRNMMGLTAYPEGQSIIKPMIGIDSFTRFVKRLNVVRGTPSEDICSTCNVYERRKQKYSNKLLTANTRKGEHARKKVQRIEEKWNAHLQRASDATEKGKSDRKEARRLTPEEEKQFLNLPLPPKSRKGVAVIRCDKGSTGRTPTLPGGVHFFCSVTGTVMYYFVGGGRGKDGEKAVCYVWEHREGGAGADGIMSAFLRYLDQYGPGTEGFIVWADNTSKEWKNWTMMMLGQYLVDDAWESPNGPAGRGQFFSFDSKFFKRGHTFMGGSGPDGIHAGVRQYAKYEIRVLKDWKDWLKAVQSCNHESITGIHHATADNRKVTEFLSQWYKKPGNRSYKLNDFCWFNFGAGLDCDGTWCEHAGEIWARKEHKYEAEITKISVRRKKKRRNIAVSSVRSNLQHRNFDTSEDNKIRGRFKNSVFRGLVKSMPVMQSDCKQIWNGVLADMFGEEALKEKKQKYNKRYLSSDDSDSDISSLGSASESIVESGSD